MRSLTLATLALLCSFAAHAGVIHYTWTNPTQYEDNTALAPSDIASTTVEYGTCASATVFGTKQGQVVATGSATAVDTPNLAPGTYCGRAFTTVVAAKGGGSSTFSNTKSFTVPVPPPPNPKPPTLLDAILAFLRRLFGHFA